MSISYLDTILNNLKTEMEDNIVPGEFYDTSPTIARGITSWSDADNKRPFIWFISTNVEYTDTMSEITEVEVSIIIYGYADAGGYDDNDNTKAMTLLKDLEYFLYNDYSASMNIINCEVKEGGIADESGQSGFILYIKVLSNFNTSTIQ